jgi:L-lactate dehydrogenase
MGPTAKIGIVGAGAVGSACVLATVMRGFAREIVLVNRNRKRAAGVVADVQYGAPLSAPVDISEGSYQELSGADVIMITAGANEKAGGATDRSDPEGRLRLLGTNAEIYNDLLPRISKAAPDAMILVVTDPPDPLADLVRRQGFARVLSTGTFLDSLRFRFQLARYLEVNPRDVEAQVIGEHGTSAVFLWSSARVGGVKVEVLAAQRGIPFETFRETVEHEVRYANITIIEGIGASQYGIGMVSARIAEIVLRNERAVIPIGSFNPRYGVTLSLPSVLGRDGIAHILNPELSAEEQRGLDRSADALKNAVSRLPQSELQTA